MAKNPFKKSSVIDTLINVGIGGAANVAVDYATTALGSTISQDYMNLGKFVVGAVGSSMVSNKMLKAAMDGVAVVGISNYIATLVNDAATPVSEATAGVPNGTVGRAKYVAPRKPYAKAFFSKKTSGVPNGTIASAIQG